MSAHVQHLQISMNLLRRKKDNVMKKNTVHRYLNTAIMVLCLSALIACSKQEESEESTSLIVIAGLHSNSRKINAPLQDKIEQIYEEFGKIGLIVIDGDPTIEQKEGSIIGSYDNSYISESKKAKKNNKEHWRQNYLQKQIATLNTEIESLQPDDAEVDTLAAFHEAVKAFNTIVSDNGETKEIIIFDTGLSTSGRLNFLNNEYLSLLTKDTKLSKDDVKNMVDSLDSTADIPDLSDIKVSWYGLGAVAEPQPELSNLQVENLKIIWGEILQRANADVSDKPGVDSDYGYFFSIISSGILSYDQPVSLVINWDNIGNSDKPDLSSIIEIPTDELFFIPDSAEFRSEEEAQKVLLPYARNLLNYPEMQILLVGTTADPSRNGGDVSLSGDRANAVKKCLVDLGIPEGQISVLGWGSKEPLYNEDEWDNNQFIESIAKTNRRVIILPYDSDLAKELLAY